jgi:hypothetical protein
MDNKVVVAVRDSACGAGGIHCNCCKGIARNRHGRKDRSFGGVVRARVKVLDAADREHDAG